MLEATDPGRSQDEAPPEPVIPATVPSSPFFFSVWGNPCRGTCFLAIPGSATPALRARETAAKTLSEIPIRAIDSALAEFIEALPQNYLLIVVSGHGFDLDNMAGDLLQEALIRMGMTVPRQTNSRYATYVPALSLDMTRSRAFCLPTAWEGLIRINLRGREPNGIVAEAEYQSVCDEIETELLALRHRHNNAPVVKAVVQPRRLYRGPFSDELPDLSVIWNTGHIVSEVVSQRCGLIERQPDLSGGCGNHRGIGFLLAYGPGVVRGRLTGRDFDIAPTISEWLGERALPDWDGLPLKLTDSKSRLAEQGL